MIKFENVSIERSGKLIWDSGSFEIKKGSVVAIIGSNGSGKTTLAKLILNLLKPTTGKIDVKTSRIGFVPQNYSLSEGSAIRAVDLVKLGVNGNKFGFSSNKERDIQKLKVENSLKLVDAESISKKRFSELSGGQQQRVAIASAIVDNPELLILDEPLSSLDLKTAREIVGVIEKLHSSLNLTSLIIAHDLALLLPILTHVLYLVDGHPHLSSINELDDNNHSDYSDLLEHLTTLKVGEHEL